jgi:hypothetical protein
MRYAAPWLGFCLLAGWNLALAAQPPSDGPAKKVTPERLQQLVEQLGHPRFTVRDKATRELEALGPDALPALRQAAKSPDAETRSRAEKLIATLEGHGHVAALLAPKRLRLNVKKVSAAEAVAELARLSGYRLELTGDRSGLDQRQVTLDTGETTFWDALQQLTRQAGLVEVAGTAPDRAPGYYQPFGIFGPKKGKKGMARPIPLNPDPAGAAPQLQLTDGKTPPPPTSLAGSVRVRIVPLPRKDDVPAGETRLLLEVAAEPRLQDFEVVGLVQVKKATDDQGQTLTMAAEPRAAPADPAEELPGPIVVVNGKILPLPDALYGSLPPPQRSVAFGLKLGAKPARSLTDLSGSVMVRARKETAARLTVDNLLQAAGQTVKGRDGCVLHVQAVEKLEGGAVRVEVALEDPGEQNPFGAAGGNLKLILNGRRLTSLQTGPPNFPKLLDAQGRAYAPAEVDHSVFNVATNQFVHHLIYRPQGAPSRLVLYQWEFVNFTVPFTLKNVPLP